MSAPVIDEALVRRLIRAQFPEWADLPVSAIVPGGHDNRTFRLGRELTVRLPSAAGYVAAVEKEQRYLPRLARATRVPIPEPVAAGAPGEGYPWPWSVNRYLPGEPARREAIADPARFARDVAAFLRDLRRAPADGPAAGEHSFFRGGPPASYDVETRAAIGALRAELGAERATGAERIWETALASSWTHPPVWFHGDVASGNLLVRGGALSAVIDFGTSGVGDPACDLVIAWTFLEGSERAVFRDAVELDPATWERARGWALWKALITAADPAHPDAADARHVIDEVLRDPVI